MANQVLFYLNDMLIELVGLQNAADDSYINDATVVITLVDSEGTEVSGEVWPLSMPYVAASDGDYRATLADTIGVTLGQQYVAKVSADAGVGLQGHWELPLTVEVRKFT